MRTRPALETDLNDVLSVERAAFGSEQEAQLTNALLGDPSAQPVLSLLACKGEQVVGHALFTRSQLETNPTLPTALLAPLAVIPEAQRQGVGGMLIRDGARQLHQAGVQLLFVLGHPSYYTRHGFLPAAEQGYDAPFPLSTPDAWMVRSLTPSPPTSPPGKVLCADTLMRPELWGV